MNITQSKRLYKKPQAEPVVFQNPLHLLVTASVDATVEDWETGEDL